MKLFKDLSANLDKILMQVEKSKIQLKNTIDSGKTSIINIKDVKSKIKDLKLNNDKSNKAFEESKLSLNQLLKLTDNYLKNPTPEKLLKVKNQIDTSNNDLVKANNVFSENKTLADKVVVSFNKYKNDDFINNLEKSIKLKQKLILSFNKNIKIIRSVNKPKPKFKSREVYSSESPTPSPACQELKQDLADKEKERKSFQEKIDKDYLLIAATIPIAQKNKDEYEKQTSYEDTAIKAMEDYVELQKEALAKYNKVQKEIEDKNKEIEKSYMQLAKIIINNPSIKAIKNQLLTIQRITGERDLKFAQLQNIIQNLGSANKQTIDELERTTKTAREVFKEKNKDIFNKMVDSQNVIKEAEEKIKFNKEVVKNYNESIKKLEDEIKLKNCP
jgi:hypothetical protein